jgi:endonuclease YncB( thermonuclease family)
MSNLSSCSFGQQSAGTVRWAGLAVPPLAWTKVSAGLLAVCCLVGCVPTLAAELVGRVVGVSDGDTLTLLDAQRKAHKIRLSGIDAPEKAQRFGERAKQELSNRVYQEEVSVIYEKTDRYGRVVGKVTLNGEDVNIQMIHTGLAWHYKAYENEQPVVDRVTYAAAEINARRKAIGLWGDVGPLPPWEWRRDRREHRNKRQ